MKIKLKTNVDKKGILHLDPRTMLFLLLIGNLSVFIMPSLTAEIILISLVLCLAFVCGSHNFVLKLAIIYFVFLGIDYMCITTFHSELANYIALFTRFLRKILPCAMLGSILIETTRVNEFMTALLKLHIPKTILIPLTVMLRYFPAISEDQQKIKNAMKMRGVSPNLIGFFKQPSQTIECIYVPLMMSASRRADELSCAAVSRGIENPRPRTSMQNIRFHTYDLVCTILAIIYFIFIWRL